MTTPSPTLGEIAADDANWIHFGLRLVAAMADPSLHGLASSDEVLAEMARLRGLKPESLMNTVTAIEYLKVHAPEKLRKKRDDPGVGPSQVHLLARLEGIDTDEVRSLRIRALRGQVSYRDLAESVREIREKALAGSNSEAQRRLLGWKRAKSFESMLHDFLVERIKELTGREDAVLVDGGRHLPVPVDYLVLAGDDPVIAIEAKAPRVKFRQSVLIETLGTCALLQKRFPEVWLVTPHGWKAGLEKAWAIAKEMRLTGLRFFTFDEANLASGAAALSEIGDREEKKPAAPSED